MFLVRWTCSRVISCLALACVSPAVFAQTTLDDVHIAPRENPERSTVTLASAQPSPVERLRPGSLIRTSVDLVLVPVSITDDLHRPVVGLDQQNFQLFENKKPQEIRNFSSEDTPVSIGIIVDTSGSMAYKLDWAHEAVTQFCEAANPQDEFFMITFANEPTVTTDFTTRVEQVENDLLTTRSKGTTALLDAIYMAVHKMRGARYARKALLILSDGGDNHSRYTEHDVKAAIKESDVAVYSVGIFDHWVSSQEELLGPDLLRSVSEMTGGTAFTLSRPNDMPAVTRAIGTQLRHQYMLAYHPEAPAHDGKWHKISVRLRLPKSFHNAFFHVGARPGYYAGGE